MPPAHWHQTMDALDVGVVIQDDSLRITYANVRATAILGVAANELVQRTSHDVRFEVVSADGTPVPDHAQPGPSALRSGQAVRDVILGVRHGDSAEWVWILASAIPELDTQGHAWQVVITFSDITAAQRAMREQEATYSCVFRSMSEGLVIHNVDGSIRTANAAAERVLGLSLEQLTGRVATDPRWQLIELDGSPVQPASIPSEITLRTGDAVSGKVMGMRKPTGEQCWLEVRADPLRESGDPKLRGVVATFTDVTLARNALLALEASRSQLQRVLDAVPGVVYQYLQPAQGEGRVTFCGGRLAEVLGVDADTVRANPNLIADILSNAGRDSMQSRIESADRASVSFEHEASFRHADGSTRWVRIYGVPEKTVDGLLYTGVALDVTETHRMADALRQKQRREAMGDIAAGIAHNFNNMLAVILPNIQLAQAEVSAAGLASLADAERAAHNAADLVRRMLALGQIDDERSAVVVDVVATVREAVHMCQQTFDRKIHIGLEERIAEACVRCDAAELQQIILNLCLNARDALQDVAQPELRVVVSGKNEDTVLIEVRDNGVGMSPDVLARLGEPFFTTKAPGFGTGLGVASTYHSVTDMGGTCGVRSLPGIGTTFIVALPRTTAQSAHTKRAKPESRSSLSGVVMVIDDEAMVRKALSRQLQRAGLDTVLADGGASALQLLADGATHTLRAILLDLSMPGMSGVELLPKLHELAPNVPVIALSGHIPDTAALGGARLILQKPLGYAQLVEALERVMGGTGNSQ